MSSSVPPAWYGRYAYSESNGSLSPEEALALQKEVEELEQRRGQLERELAIVEAQLDRNNTRLDYLKPILSPVRRINPDILGEIFLRVPTSQLRPGSHQKSLNKLLLVCKCWNEAARHTPGLWSHVWVKVDDPSLSFEGLSAWVSRAGVIPKHIEISSSCCGGVDWASFRTIVCAKKPKCVFANAILPILLTQTPGSWRSMTLNCPTSSCLSLFINLLNGVEQPGEHNGWGSIKSFELVASKWITWETPEIAAALSLIPASVTEISLHLPPMARQEQFTFQLVLWRWPLNIPRSLVKGLTFLKLTFEAKVIAPNTPLFETLQHCSSLETLDLDLSGGCVSRHEADLNPYFESNGVTLPQLRNLRLRQIAPVSMSALKVVKFPKLLEMSMSFGQDSHADRDQETPNFSTDEEDIGVVYPGKTLADFIRGDRGSPSTLKTLHLKNLSFFDGALQHIVHDLASLSHLQLEWVGLPGNADDFLDLMQAGPTCLPELKFIEITRLKHPVDREIPHLRAFAERRGIDLKLSVHNRTLWLMDKNRYFYLTGYESDDD